MELWKDIKDYEGFYQVSNCGRIWSSYRNKILTPELKEKGYLRISFVKNKIEKRYYIHRLVAETFIPNPFNLPEVNHIDNDPSNNNDWNLEWTTPKGNVQHTVNQNRNAKGEIIGTSKLTEDQVIMIRKRIANGEISQNKLAKEIGIVQQTISRIVNRKTWKHL